MERFVIILLIFCAQCARDIVVHAKPGFDKPPGLTLNSIRYHDETHKEYHIKNGIEFVHQQTSKTSKLNENTAKNTILFLGDGMSVPTLGAARVYIGGEEKSLAFEKFPYVAMSKTYCVNKQVPDSACTATAYLNGVKANYGTIGVSAKVQRKDCKAGTEKAYHTHSIAEWALNAGKSIGLVTTTRVTHASPAGVYAHTADRDWENNQDVLNAKCDDNEVDDIAEQLVHGSVGRHLKVIFGGGRRNFIGKQQKDEYGNNGKRTDGKDLINEWLHSKNSDNEQRTYVYNKTAMLALKPNENENVLGLFAPSHCEYNYKIDGISDTDPTLKEMTMKAIEILSTNPKGFFLFVEGGKIDLALHENHAHIALEETAEFSRAIQVATEMVDFNDTLVVVTADHSHTLSYGGYPDRGTNIFGVASRGDYDSLPYLKLSFANGPAYQPRNSSKREDPTLHANEINNFDYLSPVIVPLEWETHGGDDVVIYAAGPHSHLFTGSMEEHTIPHFMAYAACIGNGLKHCDQSKM